MPSLPKNLPKYIGDIKDDRLLSQVKEEKKKVAEAQERIIEEGKRRHDAKIAAFESENKEIFARKFFSMSNDQRQTAGLRQRVSFAGTGIPRGKMYYRRMIEYDRLEDEKHYGTVVPLVRQEIRYRLLSFYQLIFHLFP